MSSDTRQQLWDIFTEAVQTFDKKNDDYGDAWRRNGWRGNLSRVFEKADRVRNLAWRPDPRVPAVGDEAVVETLRDMLNTIAFTIMNMEEEVEWGHETPRSNRVSEVGKDYNGGEAKAFYEQVSAEKPHQPADDGWVATQLAEAEASVEQQHAEAHTTTIPREVLAASTNATPSTVDPTRLDGGLLTHGPDEMRAVEAQGSGHVKPRPRSRAVRDQPQA